jgi:hypothetical protein
MKIYATFTAEGKPTGCWADDVNDNIPSNAVEISKDVWQELLNPTGGAPSFVNGSVIREAATSVQLAQQTIVAIEQAEPVTQRALRELMLVIGQAYPAAQSSVFYTKAAAQEAEIVPLRAKL